MGLNQSIWTGVSGMTQHQVRLDGMSDNIANVNTVGFKKSCHQFKSIISQQLRGPVAPGDIGGINPLQVGLGTTTGENVSVFSQGGLEPTDSDSDMAIDGNGFFVLYDDRRGGEYVYSRAGNFNLDNQQYLVNPEGLHVQGINIAPGAAMPAAGTVEDILIPLGQTRAAQATSNVSMDGNINSDTTVANRTVIPTGAGTTWLTDNGRDLNVGHVETSMALYDNNTSTQASESTLLSDLSYYNNGGGLVPMFSGITDNAAADPALRQVDLSFNKGGVDYNDTYTYTAGDTLADFAAWMAGGLGDDGATAASERLTGGALGTVHLNEHTAAVDGYDAPEEQAGAFLRNFAAGDAQAVSYAGAAFPASDPTTRLSLASNRGSLNRLEDVVIRFNNANHDIFTPDIDVSQAAADNDGGEISYITTYNAAGDAETSAMRFSLINRGNNNALPNTNPASNYSTWRWSVDNPDSTTSSDLTTATGIITFDGNGDVLSAHQDAGSDITYDLSEISQVNADNSVNLVEQDGWPESYLESFVVDQEGIVNGYYSTGVNEPIARLYLGNVPNPEGLLRLGSNIWTESPATGEVTIGFPASDGLGLVRSKMLEISNVDLSEEFTNLIRTQRGYQVNSKTITTSDEMLQNLLALKR